MKRRAKIIKFPRVPVRRCEDGGGDPRHGRDSATIIILPVIRIESYADEEERRLALEPTKGRG